MEAQYGKFLDMIRSVRINVLLVDVLAGMSNYGKFLKELVSNKHKLEQISSAFLCNESSAMIQNKVPPKLRDPRSFLIPCTFSKTFSYNALADLGANINLMPYSLYKKILILVGIKRLLDDLRVTAAKLLLLVLKVNAAGMKVTTAERLQLLEEFMLTEKRSKTYQRKYKDFLKIKIT
ncbi:hypothetical protein Tco_0940137 [Tanacetum coccineum]|uniref:Reverse transcriptase domain-containing protein n=1 Tax=Tanacetum coccineum TaxID=301880 RepID=A0ABQ5DMJ7_9ASTR